MGPMTKTCRSSIVTACRMWVLFSLSSSCLSFFPSFFQIFLFLSFFIFYMPISLTSSYFFLFFFFTYLFFQLCLVSFFISSFKICGFFFFLVGLFGTFYGFLCFSIYGFYLGWYGILMVISSFWFDSWVWSSDLRYGCGVRILWCGCGGLNLRCGYGCGV